MHCLLSSTVETELRPGIIEVANGDMAVIWASECKKMVAVGSFLILRSPCRHLRTALWSFYSLIDMGIDGGARHFGPVPSLPWQLGHVRLISFSHI